MVPFAINEFQEPGSMDATEVHALVRFSRYMSLFHEIDFTMLEHQPDAISLIQGLLKVVDSDRLGCGVNGSEAVKQHSFFNGIDWLKLDAKQPPYIPPSGFGAKNTALKSDIPKNLGLEEFLKYIGKEEWSSMPIVPSDYDNFGNSHLVNEFGFADLCSDPLGVDAQINEKYFNQWDHSSAAAVVAEHNAQNDKYKSQNEKSRSITRSINFSRSETAWMTRARQLSASYDSFTVTPYH